MGLLLSASTNGCYQVYSFSISNDLTCFSPRSAERSSKVGCRNDHGFFSRRSVSLWFTALEDRRNHPSIFPLIIGGWVTYSVTAAGYPSICYVLLLLLLLLLLPSTTCMSVGFFWERFWCEDDDGVVALGVGLVEPHSLLSLLYLLSSIYTTGLHLSAWY